MYKCPIILVIYETTIHIKLKIYIYLDLETFVGLFLHYMKYS
jgi:hypothetical protein